MATQNSTITVKGKLGNIVGYKGRDGKRLARIRQTEVKNPKTDGQIIQRMILATASKAYGRMKTICDHSFQGVSYGAQSQSYFLKRAMEDTRNFVAKTLPEFPESLRNDPRAFVGLAEPKSLAYAGVGLLISEGTIPSVSVNIKTPEDGEPIFDHFGAIVTAEKATIPEVMKALGAQFGDQITIVALKGNGEVDKTRYVLEANPSEEVIADEDVWDGALSSDLFDKSKSLLTNVRLIVQGTAGSRKIVPIIEGEQGMPEAAAVIISRKVGDVWQRSSQRLVWLSDAGDFSPNFADNVLTMWQAGTTEINTENPYYLNNADL